MIDALTSDREVVVARGIGDLQLSADQRSM